MVANRLRYMTLAIIAALGIRLIVVTGGAWAQIPPGPGPGHEEVIHPASGEVTSGKLMFRSYCSPCHGTDAMGDGPVADTLKKKPANLTVLSKNNGDKFPYQEVYDMISGEKVVAEHGTREMPIWGVVFARQHMPNAPGRSPQAVKRRIDTIIAYIESIQQQ